MVKISACICISSRTLCSELSLKIKHLPKWVYHVLPLHWRFASCETADPGLQCSVVHIVTQCAMVKKGKSGLAGTRQVGLDAGIQGWSHCRTVYLPSSRAGVIGRKDDVMDSSSRSPSSKLPPVARKKQRWVEDNAKEQWLQRQWDGWRVYSLHITPC